MGCEFDCYWINIDHFRTLDDSNGNENDRREGSIISVLMTMTKPVMLGKNEDEMTIYFLKRFGQS